MYTPTDIDLKWAKNVLKLIKHNGLLCYPLTELVYLVDHNNHVLTLQTPQSLQNKGSEETHHRTKIVFAVIGYDVCDS